MSKDEYYVIVALFLFMCFCFILFVGQDEIVIFCQGSKLDGVSGKKFYHFSLELYVVGTH